jgi:hypothetical protein
LKNIVQREVRNVFSLINCNFTKGKYYDAETENILGHFGNKLFRPAGRARKNGGNAKILGIG